MSVPHRASMEQSAPQAIEQLSLRASPLLVYSRNCTIRTPRETLKERRTRNLPYITTRSPSERVTNAPSENSPRTLKVTNLTVYRTTYAPRLRP